MQTDNKAKITILKMLINPPKVMLQRLMSTLTDYENPNNESSRKYFLIITNTSGHIREMNIV